MKKRGVSYICTSLLLKKRNATTGSGFFLLDGAPWFKRLDRVVVPTGESRRSLPFILRFGSNSEFDKPYEKEREREEGEENFHFPRHKYLRAISLT